MWEDLEHDVGCCFGKLRWPENGKSQVFDVSILKDAISRKMQKLLIF